ncbi:MAG: FAD-binding oxidoreductase [Candidatus Nomurabacteria bacterium]|jgi:FAD/FMN-containing dehydrogenase|nr:FAD-binding oxidoreductase [Candidatus Nomurabacteria bacterium]
MNRIAKYLNQHIVGTVYSAPLVLMAYATDRSVLKMYPRVVAVPKNTDDIRKLVKFSNQLAIKNVSLPITVRGTGLDETGAAIGSGIIISMEKMNRILEIDPRQRLVRLQAGVKLGELQSALALHGLTLPLNGNPSLTIGGMVANHFSGSMSHKYGSIANYVSQAEVVLSSGDVIQTVALKPRALERKKAERGFEGEIYRKVDMLITNNEKAIRAIPDPGTNLSGYPLITKCKQKNGVFDILPVLYGSQGTLGVVTELIMSCDLIAEKPQYVAMLANDVKHALRISHAISGLAPSELNTYDVLLFKEASEGSKQLKMFKKLPENGMLVMAAFDDVNMRRRARKVKKLNKILQGKTKIAVSDENNYDEFVELKSILSIYLNDGFKSVRVPLVDDAYIPPNRLVDYYDMVPVLADKYEIKLPVFGSALTNYYSIRPKVDLSSVPGRQFALAFMRDYSKMVTFCGGSLAGGAPEGRLKAVFTNLAMKLEVAKFYGELKDILDPNNIMNPGIKMEASLPAVVRKLRTSYNPGVVTE